MQKGRLGPSWKAGAVTSAARWERTSVFVPQLLRWRTLRSLKTVRADSRCQPRRRGSKARGPRRHPTAPKGPSNLGRSRPPPGQGGATPPGLQALSRSVPLTGGQLGRQRSLTCHFPDACRGRTNLTLTLFHRHFTNACPSPLRQRHDGGAVATAGVPAAPGRAFRRGREARTLRGGPHRASAPRGA